jgi:AcrR family transcriptional regulator
MKSRRQQILNSAAKLFRKKGYNATSLKDIAQANNMEAPSLYNHIKSKAELLSLILLQLAETFSSGIHQINNSSLSGYQKLEKVIGHYVQISLNQPDEVSLLTGEWVHLSPSDRELYLKRRDDYENIFRHIIKQCVSEGSVYVENEDLTVFSILSTLRWLYSWISKNPNFNPIELETQLCSIILKGIYKK